MVLGYNNKKRNRTFKDTASKTLDYCIISIYSCKTMKKYTIINFDHKVIDVVSVHYEENSKGTYMSCCERRDVISSSDAETEGFTLITKEKRKSYRWFEK